MSSSSRNLDNYKVYNQLSTVMDNNSITDSGGSYGMPSTHSSQQLMSSDCPTSSPTAPVGITKMQWFTVTVLCFVNLINYMDRFTIAGKFQISLSWKSYQIYPKQLLMRCNVLIINEVHYISLIDQVNKCLKWKNSKCNI